ncbi:uncharacterized protein LOC127698326 isoform X3 [Mytilus californianus]|uniref:uncharacterized protein LOC127698326 isoform X3 n=1 Tax=Mytilus californianus TaxID=6549 RepID=UPI00224695FB|nr:uncharacterized protein LOC127698326 isoform X3 [Mytilus californianus]
MRRKNKNRESEIVNTESRDTTLSKLLGVYILVCFVVSASWAIGHYQCSFLWVFLLISGLFVLWKTKLTNIVQNRMYQEELRIHRKRALRQSETAEWLNFIINRWWVFNADTIEEVVKKRLEDRLYAIKPSYLDKLNLEVFTFGDHTPSIKYVRTFEYMDGVPGGRKPVSWVNINTPPTGLDRVSSYQLVCEVDTQNLLDQFQMVFAARVGQGRASLGFKIAVEQLRMSGILQIVLHMSKDIPFPHISKASLSFIDKPEVQFNLNVLKAVNLTELPLLKNWIYDQVMDGLAKAMVDPGQINIPISRVGAVQLKKPGGIKAQKLAQGVLTIHIVGNPIKNGDTEDVRYSTLRLGEQKRTTHDELAINDWDDICSFFVYDLKKEKITLKSKCHRLLSNVTLQQHVIELSSLPFNLQQNVNTTIENTDGSTYELKMQYTTLPQIDLEKPPDIQQFENKSGVMYICIHGASNLIASDRNGTSDPYCVAFCDRRRLLTTPFVKNTLTPRWDSSVEFFVKDFTNVMLSFYVFDWDGTNIIEDDFLGSAFSTVSEEEPVVIKKQLTLGYNKSSEGYVTDASYGKIIVSLVFRPVTSVEKSERYRVASLSDSGKRDYLYNEDLVSPSSAPTTSRSSFHRIDQEEITPTEVHKEGGGPNHQTSKKVTLAELYPTTKTMVDLTILQGRDLIAMDRNGFSDPFCIVKMGEKRLLKTSVKKKTLFPKWNESTTFEFSNENQMIEILLYDKDFISDDFLGKAMLSLDKLKEISYKSTSEWIKLQRTKSGMIQIKCTVTTNGVPMKRENDTNSIPENEVFKSETTPALQAMPDRSTEEQNHKMNGQVRKDMKPDILPYVDEVDSGHHIKEEIVVMKHDSKLSSQPPPRQELHANGATPESKKINTSLQNGDHEKSESPPKQRKSQTSPHQKRVEGENQRTSKQLGSPVPPEQSNSPTESRGRVQGRSRSSQHIESQVDGSPNQPGHPHYIRHSSPSRRSHRTSKETLIDNPPAVSSVDPYRSSPSGQGGRRGRDNSQKSPLMRSQSDMTVNSRPGYTSLMLPERDGMKHGDSMNSFTYREKDDSSDGSIRRVNFRALHSKKLNDELEHDESSSIVDHDKMYSINGEVLEVRGLPRSVSNFYCKVRLQNPNTKFRFGSNSRVIGKSHLVKADNPAVNAIFEVDRGAGTSVDALVIFDIKDGKKQHVSQHSFTIGLLFMDYQEGGITKWLSLGRTGVEVLVNLKKGNPNPRLMRKHHRHSMRMPGEKKYQQNDDDYRQHYL